MARLLLSIAAACLYGSIADAQSLPPYGPPMPPQFPRTYEIRYMAQPYGELALLAARSLFRPLSPRGRSLQSLDAPCGGQDVESAVPLQ